MQGISVKGDVLVPIAMCHLYLYRKWLQKNPNQYQILEFVKQTPWTVFSLPLVCVYLPSRLYRIDRGSLIKISTFCLWISLFTRSVTLAAANDSIDLSLTNWGLSCPLCWTSKLPLFPFMSPLAALSGHLCLAWVDLESVFSPQTSFLSLAGCWCCSCRRSCCSLIRVGLSAQISYKMQSNKIENQLKINQ